MGRNDAAITMSGGSVTDNEAGLGGGIGLYNGASLEMSGGEIARNAARDKYHMSASHAAGGGVFLGQSTSMTFSGGTIAQNRSDLYGGGVSLGGYTSNTIGYDKERKASLHMTGGVIDRNSASANGGGIFLQANTKAAISAGSITNNEVRGAKAAPLAGGGIYVSSGPHAGLDCGELTVSHALVTENRARLSGGGIGGGGASFTMSRPGNGAAIYGNDAPAAHDVLIDPAIGFGGGAGIGHRAYFSHYMPGGGEARWLRDGTEIYQGPEDNGTDRKSVV